MNKKKKIINFNLIKILIKLNFKVFKYIREIKALRKYKTINYEIVRNLCIDINKALNVEIVTKGFENVSNLSNNFVMFSNHRGFYDPILIMSLCNKDLSFVYKASLNKISLLENMAQITNSKSLDRNIENEFKTIIEIIKLQKEDNNFVIFPEGTRNYEDTFVDFMDGSFKVPLKAKAEILPIVLCGTENILDNHGKNKVLISFLKPIKYEEYKDMKTPELSNYVKNLMLEEYKKLKEKY